MLEKDTQIKEWLFKGKVIKRLIFSQKKHISRNHPSMTAKSQELINFGSFENSLNPLMQSSNPENIFIGKNFPSNPSIQQYSNTPLTRPNQQEGSNMSNTVVSEITGNIFLNKSQDSEGNEGHSEGYFDLGSQGKLHLKQMSEENHNILVNKMLKPGSIQNVSNSVDYFNQKVFIKQKSGMKAQTSSNEYYKHYSVSDKEFRSFEAGLTNKLKAFMTVLSKQKRMKPSQFWGQQDSVLGKSLVFRNEKLENDVRQQSNEVELNLKVIINRAKDENTIKNRYLIKGHIAESTFSNTFKVGQMQV